VREQLICPQRVTEVNAIPLSGHRAHEEAIKRAGDKIGHQWKPIVEITSVYLFCNRKNTLYEDFFRVKYLLHDSLGSVLIFMRGLTGLLAFYFF